MAGCFDPEDHDEFTRYVLANQRHFDEIEAQYIASKAAGNETGSIHSLFHHINLISSNCQNPNLNSTQPQDNLN